MQTLHLDIYMCQGRRLCIFMYISDLSYTHSSSELYWCLIKMFYWFIVLLYYFLFIWFTVRKPPIKNNGLAPFYLILPKRLYNVVSREKVQFECCLESGNVSLSALYWSFHCFSSGKNISITWLLLHFIQTFVVPRRSILITWITPWFGVDIHGSLMMYLTDIDDNELNCLNNYWMNCVPYILYPNGMNYKYFCNPAFTIFVQLCNHRHR